MAKLYTPYTWVDEILVGPERYDIKDDAGAAVHENVQIGLKTEVATAGTEVSAARLNNIEQGIDDLDDILNNAGLTAKTTPVAGDKLLLYDSEASGAPKSLDISTLLNGGGGAATNYLINPQFDFFTRLVTPSSWTTIFTRTSGTYTAARAYGADRWAAQCNEIATDGTAVQVMQSYMAATPAEKLYVIRMNAIGRLATYQPVEGANTYSLMGDKAIFHARLKAGNNARTVRVGLIKWAGTVDTIPARLIAAAATWTTNPTLVASATWLANSTDYALTTTAWTDVSITADLTSVTGLQNIIAVIYDSADTVAANDFIYIRRAGLHVGDTVPTWSSRQIGTESLLCKRYFEKMGGSIAKDIAVLAYYNGSLYYGFTIVYNVEKRGLPTGAVYGTWNVNNCGQPVLDTLGKGSCYIKALVTSTGTFYFLTVDTSTYLTFDAEL